MGKHVEDQFLTLRLSSDDLKRIKEAAASDDRAASSWCRLVIRRELDRREAQN
jgi:predicted DNA binding CopG/RHH family protein